MPCLRLESLRPPLVFNATVGCIFTGHTPSSPVGAPCSTQVSQGAYTTLSHLSAHTGVVLSLFEQRRTSSFLTFRGWSDPIGKPMLDTENTPGNRTLSAICPPIFLDVAFKLAVGWNLRNILADKKKFQLLQGDTLCGPTDCKVALEPLVVVEVGRLRLTNVFNRISARLSQNL